MKPVVGAMQAWSCVVISIFAIIVLSVIGSLYRTKHHEFVGGVGDPNNTGEVSSFPSVLRFPGCTPYARESTRRHRAMISDQYDSIRYNVYIYSRDYGVSQRAASYLKVALTKLRSASKNGLRPTRAVLLDCFPIDYNRLFLATRFGAPGG
ncbi:hypothetical protein FHL15_000935 [Xylaria flabelliformis]|uniref:Uncharacterized protein n=1 Tax=Xylaria flabelliformis TaxID=2512241 RepID=A0A553IDL9_9PEZI|nr:hypothetical protein FHL15_000935 [Xylaria flabelliformis]